MAVENDEDDDDDFFYEDDSFVWLRNPKTVVDWDDVED